MEPELASIHPFRDQRGELKKILRHSQVCGNKSIGEVYLLYSNHGSTRGNHYHKETWEYFTVISGKAVFALQAAAGGPVHKLILCSEDNKVLKVPPNMIHAFKNEHQQTLIILAISTREYNHQDTDTFVCEIL